jgi:hypothetical protein
MLVSLVLFCCVKAACVKTTAMTAAMAPKTLIERTAATEASTAPNTRPSGLLEGLRASSAPLAELRLSGLAVGEADGAVVGALLKASTSLSTLDLSGSSCAAEAARLIGEGLRESAAPLAELRLANVLYTTDGRMPFEAAGGPGERRVPSVAA